MSTHKLLQSCIEAMRPMAELAHALPESMNASDTLVLADTSHEPIRLTVGAVRIQAMLVAHFDRAQACLAETQPMAAFDED
jgi:hypothetical protein